MRHRRFVCFVLGIWFGVSALLAFSVYQDFSSVEQLLKSPPEQAQQVFKTLGPDNARMLLRYSAGLQNVAKYESWEYVQFVIGLAVTLFLFVDASTRKLSAVPVAMVLIVAFMHFKISPEMAWLGRSVEFVPWTAESQVRDQFWNLHRVYTILEIVKALLGLGIMGVLVAQQTSKRVRRSSSRHGAERTLESRVTSSE